MTSEFPLGHQMIGVDRPTYFVADIAANHDGDLERAKDLIQLAAEAGANAAKFQNFDASTIVSEYGFAALGVQQSHQAKWEKSVYEVYEDASLPMAWTQHLKNSCDQAGIDYFTAPYDLGLIGQLSKFVCAWKIGSGDITWLENIEAMAADGKPVLLATGAAEIEDVRRAVVAIRKHTDEFVLMQCNTNYTASVENFRHIALNVLKTYAEEFPDVILGLSDHTPGHATVLGAVALGARAIEKHFTDDMDRIGPDHAFSMDPAGWRDMVDRTRELEAALGPSEKRVMDNEKDTVVLQRRAMRACRAISKGEMISAEDIVPLRPCPVDALPPYYSDQLIGQTAGRDIKKGDYFQQSDIA